MRHAMKTQQHQITLDGVTFEGELSFYVSETRPELGPLTRSEDLGRFNRAVVRKIAELGLQGPESLRFCRKVAGLGVVEFATLLATTARPSSAGKPARSQYRGSRWHSHRRSRKGMRGARDHEGTRGVCRRTRATDDSARRRCVESDLFRAFNQWEHQTIAP